MIVAPLDDPEAVNRILRAPEIAARLRRDGNEPGHVAHPLVRYCGGWVDDRLLGVFMAVRFTPWETEVHTAILREGLPHARALSRLFLARVFDDAEVARATAYVMGTLPSAANFCRKLGFVDEGRRRDACQINGAMHDVLVLGMTRCDWESTV